jgi:Putative heavy-metal-binding
MPKMTPEREAAYALNNNLSRASLKPDVQVEYDRILCERPARLPDRQLTRPVLIVTTNEIPGYRITEVHGDVFGLTVRARNLFSNMGASLRTLAGGEVAGYTKLLTESRKEAASECGRRRGRWARTPLSRCASTAMRSATLCPR